MKKCSKCGALQSDDKRHCIDCGSLLGKSLTASEEKAEKSAIGSKVDAMADAAEDFYVPRRDKIMAILCVIGIVMAVLLLIFCYGANAEINDSIPSGVTVENSGGSVSIISPGDTPNYDYPIERVNTIGNAVICALISIVCFIVAIPMLIFPKVTWFFATLRYRLFFNSDPSPSDFAVIFFKVITYLLFGAAIISLVDGYLLFI